MTSPQPDMCDEDVEEIRTLNQYRGIIDDDVLPSIHAFNGYDPDLNNCDRNAKWKDIFGKKMSNDLNSLRNETVEDLDVVSVTVGKSDKKCILKVVELQNLKAAKSSKTDGEMETIDISIYIPKAAREKSLRLKRAYSRMAQYRQRKNPKENSDPQTTTSVTPSRTTTVIKESYNTARALSKAVAKVKRALPSTSAKKKQVIAKLLQSFDMEDKQEIINNEVILDIETTSTVRKSSRAITASTVELVRSFYERDDISRMSSNMRDCRKFTDPTTDVVELKQIRYLMYRLVDVYSLFVKFVQTGNNEKSPPVKFSKFSTLRPEHVKLVSCTPLDTCFSIYHSNFMLCCGAMHEYMSLFPSYGPELELLLVCKEPTKDCWLRRCKTCGIAKLKNTLDSIVKLSGKNLQTAVAWLQWIKDKEIKRYEKRSVCGQLSDLIGHFFNIHADFMKHSYVKRSQAQSFNHDNESVSSENGEVATLQLDFAESFNCEGQEEIALAHWNQANV